MRIRQLTLALLSGMLAFGFTAAAAPPGSAIWSGPVGKGFQLHWTPQDIRVTRNGRTVFSERDQTLPRFRQWAREGTADWRELDPDNRTDTRFRYDYQQTTRVLSAVGGIITLRRDTFTSTNYQAHPSATIAYRAIDLARPAHKLKLTELFPDRAVLDALLMDKLVKTALADHHIKPNFQGTQALVSRFSRNSVRLVADPASDCGEYYLPSDFLQRFAFHHREGNKVAVRLDVIYTAEVCRGSFAEIGLLLPIPPALQADLTAADNRKAGFLMQSLPKIQAGRETEFILTNNDR